MHGKERELWYHPEEQMESLLGELAASLASRFSCSLLVWQLISSQAWS